MRREKMEKNKATGNTREVEQPSGGKFYPNITMMDILNILKLNIRQVIK